MSVQLKLFDPLEEFEKRLPYRTGCSQTKRLSSILPKKEAMRFAYIQINYPAIYCLVFDLDYPVVPLAYDEYDLPGPSITVMSPDSHRGNGMYQLLDPVRREGQSKATKALLKDVCNAYKEMLCADKCITTQRQLVKNPLSSKWMVIAGYKPFTLSELAEYIPGELKHKRTYEPTARQPLSVKPFEETLQPHSRNCSLFENARLYAYSVVNDYGSYTSFYNAVVDYLQEMNDTQIPLYFPNKVGMSELCSIARSISGWTFERGHQFKPVRKGAMAFPSMRGVYWQPEDYHSEVKKRRSLSAQRTNEARKEGTRQKIREAINLCRKHGLEPNMENIRTASRLGQRTVYRYKELIQENI